MAALSVAAEDEARGLGGSIAARAVEAQGLPGMNLTAIGEWRRVHDGFMRRISTGADRFVYQHIQGNPASYYRVPLFPTLDTIANAKAVAFCNWIATAKTLQEHPDSKWESGAQMVTVSYDLCSDDSTIKVTDCRVGEEAP